MKISILKISTRHTFSFLCHFEKKVEIYAHTVLYNSDLIKHQKWRVMMLLEKDGSISSTNM